MARKLTVHLALIKTDATKSNFSAIWSIKASHYICEAVISILFARNTWFNERFSRNLLNTQTSLCKYEANVNVALSWALILTERHEDENKSLYGIWFDSGISPIKQSCVSELQSGQTAFWFVSNINKYQWKQTSIFSKWKCQFSPAIDSDDFYQLKEAKQAFVGDKLCER